MSNASAQARLNMVDGQIKPFSVIDQHVLAAFLNIPRENFLPDSHQGLAYLGEDLPLGEGRFLLEPSAYARLLQEANITREETVLDVGCATGYTSCILASLAKDVVAIDSAKWVDAAKKNAAKIGAVNIAFAETSDDFKKTTAGPFDVIVINGAVQEVPGYITEQLKEGGRVATFIRNDRGEGHAVLFHKHKNGLHQQIIFDAFIPMLPGFAMPEKFTF